MTLTYTVNVHGDAGYGHGCRCDECGAGRLYAQRARRGTRKPRASKYDGAPPASAPEVLAAFRERVQGVT